MIDGPEERLEDLMREAAADYRPVPEPRVEAMWQRIEARAFARPVRRGWTGPLALAAMLFLGLGVGFWAGTRASPSVAPEAAALADPRFQLASAGATPFVGVAGNYLQQMTGLMIAVAEDLRSGQVPASTVTRARDLLSTTRLLLDGSLDDPALRDLLEDLELVLVQVVRLRDAGQAADAAIITQALDQREVLPRLTSYLADANVAP